MRTGDRPTIPLPSLPSLFPIPAIPSYKVPSLCSGLLSRCSQMPRYISETLRERVLCGQARHSLAAQLPVSKFIAPILSSRGQELSYHMPVPSSRTQDRTKKKRHRLLTGWVWGMVPKGRFDIMVIPLVNTSHPPTLLQGRPGNGVYMLVAGVLCCLCPSLLRCPTLSRPAGLPC